MAVLHLLAFITLLALSVRYVITVHNYQSCRNQETAKSLSGAKQNQLPPRYPSFVPFLGSVVAYVWDNEEFLRKATTCKNNLTSTRIPFLGRDIYAFQDRQTIKRLFHTPALASPMSMYIFALKYLFGFPESALKVYRRDNSGPLPRPHPATRVPESERIDHLTHLPYLWQFQGAGLNTTTRRFMRSLARRLREELQGASPLSQGGAEESEYEYEWKTMPDWATVLQNAVGGALIESIFGKTLLDLNPGFVRDAFELDAAAIPWFARGFPRWMAPRAWAVRDRMIASVKKWYSAARKGFDETLVDQDGDGDPYWGSELTRYRQRVLSQMPGHDDDVLARSDVGLVWGAVGNSAPVAMMAAYHMFEDRWLLERVRLDVDAGRFCAADGVSNSFDEETADARKLSRHSLLSSIYAETLRRYVNSYAMLSSPHTDVSLGEWRLPRGETALCSAGTSQSDPFFWNSRGGMYPVHKFWAERFLVDPRDPDSGPISPAARLADLEADGKCPDPDRVEPDKADKAPYFTLEGTEGSWFPFGGGHSICPGRFFAKNAILFTCALLAREYDVEPLVRSDEIKRITWKFGLGVHPPAHDLPFRVRKRRI